jgi:Holliday junction resolvase RusA-like endonuclease
MTRKVCVGMSALLVHITVTTMLGQAGFARKLCSATSNGLGRVLIFSWMLVIISLINGKYVCALLSTRSVKTCIPKCLAAAVGKRRVKQIQNPMDSIILDDSNCSEQDRQLERELVGEGCKQVPTKNLNKKKDIKKYWISDADEFLIQYPSFSLEDMNGSENNTPKQPPSLLQFTIRGNPVPLQRHRTARGFTYNPSASAQSSFRDLVLCLLSRFNTHSERNDDNLQNTSSESSTIWGSDHALSMTIVFRMKRPNSHFIGNKPGYDRLRKTAPDQAHNALRTDVDNLAKFVLDSLNGILYTDDRQIVSLHVTKLYDNDTLELCNGSTCVQLRLIQESDVTKLLKTSFDLF